MKIIRLALFIFLSLFLSFANASVIHKTKYIIDTDMGFDDWLAVIYLLEQKNIDVAGITVDCQGETRCPAGAINAARLTYLTKRDVPIAMGAVETKQPYAFPKIIRDFATNMAVPGFLHLPVDHDISKLTAAEFIKQTVIQSALHHNHVVIISIGTADNIDDAWKSAKKDHQEKLFRAGLKMIYKGGGAFGEIEHHIITNKKIPGNISIPGMITSNDRDAEWNIYANAENMSDIINAKLPVTFVPNNATDQVHMTKAAYEKMLVNSGAHSPSRFCANAMLLLIKMQGGWRIATPELDFWDTATTISALHPSIVSEKFNAIPVRIITKPGDRYAATWISNVSASDPITIYYHLHRDLFYKYLLKGIYLRAPTPINNDCANQ